MSKIKSLLKSSLENARWDDVSKAYFLLTGENLTVKEITKDPLSMKKRELYNYINENIRTLGAFSDYEIEDLRLIYTEHIESSPSNTGNIKASSKTIVYNVDSVLTAPSQVNMSPQPDISYISPKRAANMLNIDKQSITVELNDFDSYGDEPPPKQKNKRQRFTVTSKCKFCSKVQSLDPVLTYGVGNERTHICEKCGAKP